LEKSHHIPCLSLNDAGVFEVCPLVAFIGRVAIDVAGVAVRGGQGRWARDRAQNGLYTRLSYASGLHDVLRRVSY
jgi:hypothetical protein